MPMLQRVITGSPVSEVVEDFLDRLDQPRRQKTIADILSQSEEVRQALVEGKLTLTQVDQYVRSFNEWNETPFTGRLPPKAKSLLEPVGANMLPPGVRQQVKDWLDLMQPEIYTNLSLQVISPCRSGDPVSATAAVDAPTQSKSTSRTFSNVSPSDYVHPSMDETGKDENFDSGSEQVNSKLTYLTGEVFANTRRRKLKCIVQIDDGSSINLIRADLAHKLGAVFSSSRRCRVRGVGGMVAITQECTIHVKFRGTRVEYRHLSAASNIGTRFLVMDNCPVPMLIGSNTMHDLHAKHTLIGDPTRVVRTLVKHLNYDTEVAPKIFMNDYEKVPKDNQTKDDPASCSSMSSEPIVIPTDSYELAQKFQTPSEKFVGLCSSMHVPTSTYQATSSPSVSSSSTLSNQEVEEQLLKSVLCPGSEFATQVLEHLNSQDKKTYQSFMARTEDEARQGKRIDRRILTKTLLLHRDHHGWSIGLTRNTSGKLDVPSCEMLSSDVTAESSMVRHLQETIGINIPHEDLTFLKSER